jgi:hypothetical protein
VGYLRRERRAAGDRFYETYNGHTASRLADVTAGLARAHKDGTPRIFLAGDSSLDNKHWLFPGYSQASAARAIAP